MNPYSILFITLLSAILLIILPLHFKKKKCIQKTRSLSVLEKTTLLNNLTQNLGYSYNPYQDVFLSRQDAPQKLFGYHTFYDYAAAFFHMVFDFETIYFDYRGHTWLIELWKGQYGICSGCELGVYYNETIVSPDKYKDTHFDAVAPKDMLLTSLQLYDSKNPGTIIGYAKERHWWLTLFHLPYFANPKNLHVDISIRFQDYEMLTAFINSFETTLPLTPYQVQGLTVSFPFHQSLRKYRLSQRIVRSIALNSCHLLCNGFRLLTHPFTSGGDKVIYLYFYLPFFIRLLFHIPKSTHKE